MIALYALVGAYFLRFRKPHLDSPFMAEDVQMERGFWAWVIEHDFIVGGSLVCAPFIIGAIMIGVIMP